LLAAVRENIGQAGQRLFFPSTDLGRMDPEHVCQLGRRLVRLDGLPGYLSSSQFRQYAPRGTSSL
jgi:hypothetical protein